MAAPKRRESSFEKVVRRKFKESFRELHRSSRVGGMLGFELDRSRTNCVELERTRARQKNGQKPTNYEEWSKSNELDRTLTPNFVKPWFQRDKRDFFEQKDTKFTKGRKNASGWGFVLTVRADRNECIVLYSFDPFVNFCSKSFLFHC